MLGHLLQKVLSSWPLHDIDVGDAALDIYWNCVVGVPNWVKLTVYQSFIQI